MIDDRRTVVAKPTAPVAPTPRRILEAIAPAPVALIQTPSEVESAAEFADSEPPPRKRGRRAGAIVAKDLADDQPAPPTRGRKSAPRQPAPRQRATNEGAALPVVVDSYFSPAPATPNASMKRAHPDRVEAANALPRGERWKRRLPKALW